MILQELLFNINIFVMAILHWTQYELCDELLSTHVYRVVYLFFTLTHSSIFQDPSRFYTGTRWVGYQSLAVRTTAQKRSWIIQLL